MEAPITWLFEPESFSPLGKLVGGQRLGIVTDHLGTPVQMFDEDGREARGARVDGYGGLRHVRGGRQACPFRWPGQYEDEETGLHYNRFRYYDPESGQYTASDPIGLAGGLRMYSYVADVSRDVDLRGLVACNDTRIGPQSHQEQFAEGGSFFMPGTTWNWLKANKTHVGYSSGLFVTTKAEADRLVAAGDRALLKQRLGIPADAWNQPLVRIDVPDALDRTPRLPSGLEQGANDLFRAGGYTSGGAPELVIDPVPISAATVSGPFF